MVPDMPAVYHLQKQTNKKNGIGVCAVDLQSLKITHMQHDKQNSHSSQTPRRAFQVHR